MSGVNGRSQKGAVVAFCCRWCSYEGADAAGRARLPVPEAVRVIRVPCSGRVDAGLVLNAFELGAAGVLVLGCRLEDCHYRTGAATASRRVGLLRRVLEGLGVEPGRLIFDSVAASEGQRFSDVVCRAHDAIRAMEGDGEDG